MHSVVSSMPPSLAFAIPELLEQIFVHLNQHTLRYHVRFVSRQWNTVCIHFLDFETRARLAHMVNSKVLEVELPLGQQLHESPSISTKKRLAAATTLDLRFLHRHYHPNPFPPNFLFMLNFYSITWDSFLDSSQYGPLTRHASERTVETLHLYADHTLLPFIVPLFQCFKSHNLTTLRIVMHRVSEQMIYLGQILALAPSLRSIYLESLDHSGNLANQPTEPGTGPLMETAECRSSVTSLVIKRFCIKQPELEAILERHCRNLETFHIISAARISYRDLTDWTLPLVDIFDRREFLQTVRVLCPKINSLHFSFFHPDPERDSMVPLMQTFPRLKELSMPDADLSQYSVQLHQYLRQLTRLEIVPKVVAMDSLVKTLHNLLCDAPNLEHLIASKFPFRAEFFDVQSSSSTSSSPLTVAAERPWACRRLKTLHLGFDGSTTSRFYTRAGTSRLVFGYLGKVVPRLEDLALSGIPLYMGREGGLCLLSRLKNLERLDLQSAVKVSFDEDSFEWMDTGSSGSEARGLEWGPRRESKPEMWKLLVEELVANTNSARINGLKSRVIDLQHAGQVEHDALIENDFCRVGSMVDVEECLQEIAQVSVCRKLMAQVPDGAREHNSNLDHYLELLKSLGLKPVLPRFHFCRIYFPLTVPSAAGSSSQETELTKIFSRYRPAVQLDIHHWNPKARVDV